MSEITYIVHREISALNIWDRINTPILATFFSNPMGQKEKELLYHIEFIYGIEDAQHIHRHILKIIENHQGLLPNSYKSKATDRISEKDNILITYGDMIQKEGEPHLETLTKFLVKNLDNGINTIHLLPFYPYSSDDGFSIIDYHQVDPALGTWEDIQQLGNNFRLMFDAVINHISSQSDWFQKYLQGDPTYQDFFIELEEDFDKSSVFRPRDLPLTTKVNTPKGTKQVWTTFSEDQIDLNFRNPELLLRIVDLLLFYVDMGAEFIRLDAIAFIWKESGTRCIHLPKTHRIIQLFRTILDMIAPGVSIITETNVPHDENISYFGDGSNEAQMVYNFPLPPLTLHAFHTGSGKILSKWASTLSTPSTRTTFFNFLASHDGIGLMPAKGILAENEIAKMASRVKKLGGYVSYKSNSDGSKSPYELNINFLDALGDQENSTEDITLIAKRFLASQSIMLVLRGVPGIYFHSLFGSRNWEKGVERTSRYRSINREKLSLENLETQIGDDRYLRYHVYRGYMKMLKARKQNSAFHPMGFQEILRIEDAIFSVLRKSKNDRNILLSLTNLSHQEVKLTINEGIVQKLNSHFFKDIISGGQIVAENGEINLQIEPYQVLWLVSDGS